ncbi:MAG: hypothetical protein ACK2TW_10485 [Anaerolineales bacterium]
MTSVEIDPLPPDYQKVLTYAQQLHNIDVVLLEQLKGGRTAAHLYLASVTQEREQQLKHFVLKIDRIQKYADQSEITLHKLASEQAPGDFSQVHIADLVFECMHGEFIALFYDVAGGSLLQYRPVAYYQNQDQLEKIFRITNELVLEEWNAAAGYAQAVFPQELLQQWLGYRLTPQGYIKGFLESNLNIDPDIPGFLINGSVYPNPFHYGREPALWEGVRRIDSIRGHQHGDLNLGNILVKFNRQNKNLDGIYLIDFSLYNERMPLMYDSHYLEMSYLLCELDHTPIHKWVSLVTLYAEEETPLTSQVPVELAGACGVINEGRKYFRDWLNLNHASLVDDLWGQFWLAGVAAGLNFCNKRSLPPFERLAGLIYAAAHLKRFFTEFGIKLPVNVSSIYDRDQPPEFVLASDRDRAISDKDNELPCEIQGSLTDRYLPVGGDTLVGRKSEVEAVTQLLEQNRLVTLNGPGGIGKTRLALAVADGQWEKFCHGVYFVPLLPVRYPSGVVPAIAGSLGLNFLEGRTPQDQLLDYLRPRNLLLVLDNLEQLLIAGKSAETVEIIERLLFAGPDLRLLVTSRELLRISGEKAFMVEGLPLRELETGGDVFEESAADLFCLRARNVNPSFKLDVGENRKLVQQFCQKVEGMPLAIELAASQLRILTLEDISNRIDANLDVLDSGLRGERARHASINVVFEASWQTLTNDEQKIFSRLAVFRGGFTLEAALQVAHGSLAQLSQLIDKSLISRDSENRYAMHALIQMFAARKLVEMPGEWSSTQENHFRYYHEQLHNAVLLWRESSDTGLIDQIKPEVDNLRIAWIWISGQQDWNRTADFSEDLWHLLKVLGRLPEAIEMLCEALQAGRSADPSADPIYMARWERHIGQAHLWLSQLNEGNVHFRRSLSQMEWTLPDSKVGLAYGMATQAVIQLLHRAFPSFFIGRLAEKQAEICEAFIVYENITMRAGVESDTFISSYCGLRSLNLAESAGLNAEMARAYTTTGYMLGLVPLRRMAESYLRRSQKLLRRVYTAESDMWISLMLGFYHFGLGSLDTAEDSFQHTAKLAGDLGKHWEKEIAWTQLFIIALVKGEWNRSLEFVKRIAISAQKRGDAGFLAAVIYWEATVKLYRGEMDGVIQLLEESASAPSDVMMVFDWLVLRSSLATAYVRLGDFESAVLEVKELERLLAGISRPSGPGYIFGYLGTANVYLELAELEMDEEKRSDYLIHTKQACKRLLAFARLFPFAMTQSWLCRGRYEWLIGKKDNALQSWSKSLSYATEMDVRYQQGLAHYEIGSHLAAGEIGPDGSGASAHLQRAYQIFAALDAVYDLNRTITGLEKLGVDS